MDLNFTSGRYSISVPTTPEHKMKRISIVNGLKSMHLSVLIADILDCTMIQCNHSHFARWPISLRSRPNV